MIAIDIPEGVLNRAQGCLLGQIAGDSLCSLVEFKDANTIRKLYPDGVRELTDGGVWDTLAGQPTDDSEMALALARSLVSNGEFSTDEVRRSYVRWYESDPFDMGRTTECGLKGDPILDSQANGALMRVSPLGIFGWRMEPEALGKLAAEDATITHPNRICQQVNGLYATAVAEAIREGLAPEALHEQMAVRAEQWNVERAIQDRIEQAQTRRPPEYMIQMGWVLTAFHNALYELLHAPTLKDGVTGTVQCGGDRGMLTEARIREEVEPAGLDWISALRGPAIRALVESGAVQLSLFDERDLVEVTSDAYPGERLMVCRNPLLAEERARKRAALLDATEAVLAPIGAATRREKRRLRGESKIGARVGRVIARYKMAKHFEWSIDEKEGFTYRRNASSIAAEAALDGLYVVRTSVPETELDAHGSVRAYKRLSTVERAFRSLKTVDLKVRPVFHRSAERVRAHVLLCMLAYYVEWHMRQRLRPMLFDDEDCEGAEAARTSIVAPAQVSEAAQAKARSKRTADGGPVHSLRTLLNDLATVTRNTVAPRLPGTEPFEVITRPTPLQDKALKLLGVRLSCSQ